VYRSSCDVYYGDTYLGKARIKKRIRIPGNSNKQHIFNLKGKFKNVSLADATKLLSGKSQSIELKGYIKAGKFFYKKKFPINQKQKISLGR
jgi:LEA14-like dessication related protein